MASLKLLFKKENVNIIELESELSKNELLANIVDYGTINENSQIDYFYKEEMYNLYSYTVNYENNKYLFYEKVEILNDKNGNIKHGNYKSIEIYQVV